MELLRSNSRLGSLISLIILSGMVHTRVESLQGELRDIRTHRLTLASAYMLCHLFAV